MTRDGTLGFGTSPLSDEVVVIDLTTQPVTKLRTIPLQPFPGTGNNQPDALGGGDPIVSDTVPVSLRAAGQVALVDAESFEINRFVEITDPSPPGARTSCSPRSGPLPGSPSSTRPSRSGARTRSAARCGSPTSSSPTAAPSVRS